MLQLTPLATMYRVGKCICIQTILMIIDNRYRLVINKSKRMLNNLLQNIYKVDDVTVRLFYSLFGSNYYLKIYMTFFNFFFSHALNVVETKKLTGSQYPYRGFRRDAACAYRRGVPTRRVPSRPTLRWVVEDSSDLQLSCRQGWACIVSGHVARLLIRSVDTCHYIESII